MKFEKSSHELTRISYVPGFVNEYSRNGLSDVALPASTPYGLPRLVLSGTVVLSGPNSSSIGRAT